jgi:hypothetical protein
MLSVPAREECLVSVIAHMGKGRIGSWSQWGGDRKALAFLSYAGIP